MASKLTASIIGKTSTEFIIGVRRIGDPSGI